MRLAKLRTKTMLGALATVGVLVTGIAGAPMASAVTYPVHGTWDCDAFWANWSMSRSTQLSVEPHLAISARAVLVRYSSGRVYYYYGPWVTNSFTTHKLSSVSAVDGTWSGSYMQDSYGAGQSMHLLYNGGSTSQRCT